MIPDRQTYSDRQNATRTEAGDGHDRHLDVRPPEGSFRSAGSEGAVVTRPALEVAQCQ